jgi:cell division protein FtsB
MRFLQSWLFIVTLPVLLISSYRFVEEFQNWQKARQVKQDYLEKLGELEQKRDRLKLRAEKLKSDELNQERLVRQFGFIKPGETVYKVVKSRTTSFIED